MMEKSKIAGEIILTCIDKDKNVRVYNIYYKGQLFTIQFYQRIEDDTLYLESVDIEGAHQNAFGLKFKRVIKEVSFEFCKKHNVHHIEISGSRRGVGKTKGKFLQTIKLSFKNFV